jgi:hypothetical protein
MYILVYSILSIVILSTALATSKKADMSDLLNVHTIDYAELELSETLGTGAFGKKRKNTTKEERNNTCFSPLQFPRSGVVRKAMYRGRPVAAKILTDLARQSLSNLQSFFSEIHIFTQLPAHKNVVQFIGFCEEPVRRRRRRRRRSML